MAGNISIFTGNNDPLLGVSANYEAHYKELEQLGQAIEQRKQSLQQMKAQMTAQQRQQTPQQTHTPIWDEIDGIVDDISPKERELIFNNDEFIDSNNDVMRILQEKYLQMMRPIVEGSQEGRDALERHLTLLKRLRKTASSEVARQMSDFKEYTERYSDMPYNDYLKMKRGDTGTTGTAAKTERR